MKTTISDIHAGLPDAKDDITLHRQEFMDDYVIPPRLAIRNLADDDLCFIIGNKGLGKTALLRYLNQYLVNMDGRTKSTFLLFDRGVRQQSRERLVKVANQDYVTYALDDDSGLTVMDFSLVWRWHIYLTIIRDNADGAIFAKDAEWKKFCRFVLGVMKDSFKVKVSAGVEIGIPDEAPAYLPPLFDFFKPHTSIEFPEFQLGRKSCTFEEAMAEADEHFALLRRYATPYYLFFDELDVYYGREDLYRRDLRLVYDLAFEVKRLNSLIHAQGWHHTKAFCTLRPEVLEAAEGLFPARSLAREIRGLEFLLSWASDAKETYSLPIMSLLLQRIKNAEKANGEDAGTDGERYERWFPEQIEGMEPAEYIRALTWSRPRDIVRLLDAAIKARGREKAFSEHVFEDLMREYSSGSLMEIKGELEASYPKADLDLIFECFMDMPRTFGREEFQDVFEEIRPELARKVDSSTVLKDLYRVGAVGQVSQNRERWSYLRDEHNRRLPYILHKGLVFRLGAVDGSGHRTKDELPDAEEAYEKASSFYFGRNGFAQDYDEAVKWYRLAADQGDARAQCDLGLMYYKGRVIPQDYEEAGKWFRLAAKQRHVLALCNLGWMYYNGEGVPQDYEEAEKWFRLAAAQRNVLVQGNQWQMYYGQGADQDCEKTLKWFRLLVEYETARVQCMLGRMYCQGQGVPVDYEEALKWFRLAAEQGDASALWNLGQMYEHGKGVVQNKKEALRWYRLAAEKGNEYARAKVKKLSENEP